MRFCIGPTRLTSRFSLLVILLGDSVPSSPFYRYQLYSNSATTHTDILLRARALRIPTRVIHNASIMNAVGAAGLQLYQFGQTVSLVFFTETWKPDSFYDRIKEHADLGLHTLVLLDIKVKEISDENLARLGSSTCPVPIDVQFLVFSGRKIYDPPRYMSIPRAVNQLLEIESIRKAGILDADTTLAVALSRVGGGDDQRIVAGTLADLANSPEESFGEPLHSLIVVGRRLHHLEVEYAEDFAVDRERWRNVASTVYGCALD
jgi:diphthine synthase